MKKILITAFLFITVCAKSQTIGEVLKMISDSNKTLTKPVTMSNYGSNFTAPTNVDPTTSTTPGKVGMAINVNTGNWQFVTNVTGTAPTVTDLGANFPVNTTDYLRLILYAAPNGSEIRWRVDNISTGNTTNGTVTTNLPASATLLTQQAWITNNATAAAAAIDISKIYVESNQ